MISAPSKREDTLRLVAVAALILSLPALLAGGLLSKAEFDDGPLKRLQEIRPAFVFIGDSMLGTRIDTDTFEAISGEKTVRVQDDGSASARWYLMFKNYVVASGIKPKRVFIFFRDWNWEWPEYRTGGRYRDSIEATTRGEDPVVEMLLEHGAKGWKGRFQDAVTRVYPVGGRSGEARDRMDAAALWLLRKTGWSTEALNKDMEQAFELRDLRSGMPAEMADNEGPIPADFRVDENTSFLPHVIALAKEHRIPLTFVRVKRRPNRPDNVRYENPSMLTYIAGLKQYLELQGVGWMDSTHDAEITEEMYSDGDHIAPEWKKWYTKRFFERYQTIEKENGEIGKR